MDDALHNLNQWRSISSITVLTLVLAWESLAPFLTYFAGSTGERVRHGLKGLLNWLTLPAWARLAGAFLLFDAWMYWWHRLNHRVPFLWRFHRTHHSDPKMDVTTANRFHIGEIALSSLLRVPVIALLGLQLWELALYELAMFTVVQLHHANIAFPSWLDRALRVIIVTPFMHKVHHSRWQPETDSNYSSLFSFWDRLFRSFRLRDDPRTLRFGLDEFNRPEAHTLRGLLATPLKQVQRATGEPPAKSTTGL
jgi:sterol desaturase/sphingolipid hydroxylase (fatty acid hydroxylase superfamily)